ncbi:hypothetical protein NGRA_1587 [Nosema granulosis]|uniref:Major facilitator superfamily associated domain-containing protein n=1 Tax=Nosema granulosis TaxID=83296 RepID=A0A9P6GY67_9MICR|nr:hypothetical protein NGRA_1587 [Nosema granulosis]
MSLSDLNKKYLLVPKLLFFFITLHYYTLHTFRSVFAKDKFGIDNKALGFGMGILSCSTFFTNIYLGSLNDKWGASKWFIIGAMTLSSFFFQLFYFPVYAESFPLAFWFNMFLYLASNLVIPPLLDKTILEYLSKMPNIGAKTYGRQRLWGTIGYAISNYLVEYSIKGKSKTDPDDFDGLRMYNLLAAGVGIFLCYTLINWSTSRRAHARSDIWTSFKELLGNWDYMFFLFIILLNGLTRASMTIFLTVYWKEVLDIQPYEMPTWMPSFLSAPLDFANSNVIATANMFGIFLEVLIFFTSSFIINKFGYFWPLFFAQVAQLTRFAAYWLLQYDSSNAYFFVCSFELLKGLNFGLTHCSAVQLATRLCPPHLKATSQMLYQGTFTALGSVLAGLMVRPIFKESSMKGKDIPIDIKAGSFKLFFFVNMAFTGLTLILFFYMYGIVENVLFDQANAQKKLDMYVEREKDDESIKKMIKEKTVTN